MYKSKSNSDFDKAELMLYEEVTRMPPFRRKTLVLIGVPGVGRRTLKNRLINSDPNKFGAITPRKMIKVLLHQLNCIITFGITFRYISTTTST